MATAQTLSASKAKHHSNSFMQLTCSMLTSKSHRLYTVITCTRNISRDVLWPFISVQQTDSYLAVSVGVGCSWVAAGGERVVCTQWQGSVECRGSVPDCSVGPYTDYWNLSAVIQTGWIKERTEQEWEHRQVTNTWELWYQRMITTDDDVYQSYILLYLYSKREKNVSTF